VKLRHDWSIAVVDWEIDGDALREVRKAVFVVEQGVPESLEWDDHDEGSIHALARDGKGRAIGCGRLLPDGHIGRLAVLAPWRGEGIGAALLAELTGLAHSAGHARAILNAQTRAVAFYERYGFVAIGDVFEEAGIPHRVMERTFG